RSRGRARRAAAPRRTRVAADAADRGRREAMRAARAIGVALLVVAASPVAAAEEQPAAWAHGRHIADWTSTAMVGAQLGAAVWTAARGPNRGHALGCLALQVGATIGPAEATKRLVSRTRPNGVDDKSFYSEHTALATVASGWNFQIGIPIAIGTGYLRAASDWHYWSDIGAGAGAGLLARKVCRA